MTTEDPRDQQAKQTSAAIVANAITLALEIGAPLELIIDQAWLATAGHGMALVGPLATANAIRAYADAVETGKFPTSGFMRAATLA